MLQRDQLKPKRAFFRERQQARLPPSQLSALFTGAARRVLGSWPNSAGHALHARGQRGALGRSGSGAVMAVKRRMAPENAGTRVLLMDAVEALMREQGYAVLSARAVAARAGLKYPTVFYYFETMDELLLATYRRRLKSVRERTEAALNSPRPLHALWDSLSEPSDAA